MKFLDNIAKRFGYVNKKDWKPWADVPELPTFSPVMDEAPPDWKATDYLKAAKSWVYACVAAIADEVASINFRLYRRKGGKIEEITEHPLLDLLYRVNDFTTKFDHFWLTQDYLELTGEAPWVLERNGKKEPTAIYLLRPDKLKIKFDKEKIISKYVYDVGWNKTEDFEPEQVIFLKYPNPLKPFRGTGTLEAAVKTVDLDKYAEEWNVQFFFNAARPDALLTTDKTLTPEQREFLKKQWDKNFKGIKKRAKMAILEAGLNYKQMQLSQKDMDFLAQQKFSRDKILSIFRVPKAIISITDDVNRANAETQAYSFAKWTIKPKMTRIVEQLNEFLVPMFGDDLFLGFDDPVPENVKLKIEKYKAALDLRSGWQTINEIREEEKLPPVDDGDSVLRVGGGPGELIEQVGGKEEEKIYAFKVKKIGKKKEYPIELIKLNARNSKKRKIEEISDNIKSIIKFHSIKEVRKERERKKRIDKGLKSVAKSHLIKKKNRQLIKTKKDV